MYHQSATILSALVGTSILYSAVYRKGLMCVKLPGIEITIDTRDHDKHLDKLSPQSSNVSVTALLKRLMDIFKGNS